MNILLPIETINREIDYKIILANLLSNKNHRIFIGQHDFLISLLDKIEGGVYLGKNIFHKSSKNETGRLLKLLKQKKIHVIFLHEEGAVFPGDENDWKNVIKDQYNINLFDEKDTICTWGDFQERFDRERSDKNLNIITTGHPRFDIYKKKWRNFYYDDVQKLKKCFGKYVLINGNYSVANHGLGLKHIFKDQGILDTEGVQERLQRISSFTYFTSQLVNMIKLTYTLSIHFPKLNFIYRPHPSESREYYETIFSGRSNIFVNSEGSVGPWLLGAEALLHDGCTTAIEAALLKIPVINFKPIDDTRYDIWLPNQFGVKASTIDKVIALLRRLETINVDYEAIESIDNISSLLYNFKGDSFSALLKLIDSKIKSSNDTQNSHISDFFIAKKFLSYRVKLFLFKYYSSMNMRKSNYHRNKFYGFKSDTMERKLDSAFGITNIRSHIKYHNRFLIEIQ